MGSGDTREEVDSDHEQNLHNLQTRCTERNIRLHKKKSLLKQMQINFMGHLITNEGLHADQSRVETITSMPAPTDVHGVRRFCGIIQYLSQFLQNLASDLQPLQELTKKDVDWNCSVETEVKQEITKSPLLTYFNRDKE